MSNCPCDYPPTPPCPPVPPMPHANINQTILACGTGSGIILPSHRESQSQLYNPYVVASVSLDISRLIEPTVKLDFSSIITYKEEGHWPSDLRLVFRLSKNCNGASIHLGTWNFERFFDVDHGILADAQQTNSDYCLKVQTEIVDSFGFTWCECKACPGCCVYSVELINVESKNVDYSAVNNPSINALAVGKLANIR